MDQRLEIAKLGILSVTFIVVTFLCCMTWHLCTVSSNEAEIKRHEIQLKTWQAVEKAGYKEVR